MIVNILAPCGSADSGDTRLKRRFNLSHHEYQCSRKSVRIKVTGPKYSLQIHNMTQWRIIALFNKKLCDNEPIDLLFW